MTYRRRQPGRPRRKRRSEPFLEKGLTAMVLGVGLWIASSLPTSNPMLKAVGQGVKTPALFAMGIGAVLLAVHVLLRLIQQRKAVPPPDAVLPTSTAPRAVPEEHPASVPPLSTEAPMAPARPGVPRPPTSWSPDVLSAIEWRRFEAVVEKLFAQAGFETRSQSHGADGGVDIWLRSPPAEGPVAVVQCKHWQGKPVGVREVREFLGVMTSHGLARGTYATSSTFTADALAFAKANGINVQDGHGLLRLIGSRTPEQQAELLAVATEGEYWRPTCASCGVKMVARQPKSGGAPFWGCPAYPKCRSTLPMKSSTALRG